MIRFSCPSCGHRIKAPDEAVGRTGKCKCGESVRVPTPNPFEQHKVERRSQRAEHISVETQPTPSPNPIPTPTSVPPLGEMIPCYACRRRVADNATTCPKCGAVQTPEGREKGRLIKKHSDFITLVVVCVVALPISTCMIGGAFIGNRSTSPPEKRLPVGWNRDQLERDVKEAVRDPRKTILIPYDGSQPRVVPSSDLDPP